MIGRATDTTNVGFRNIDAVRSNFNIYEPEYRWRSPKIKGGREGSCHMLLLLLPLPIFHHSLGHHHEQPHHFNTVQQQQLCVGTSHVTSKLFPAAARGGVYNCVGGAICWKSSAASGKGTEKTRHTTLPESLPPCFFLSSHSANTWRRLTHPILYCRSPVHVWCTNHGSNI